MLNDAIANDMKDKAIGSCRNVLSCILIALACISCNYQEIEDAPYPEQTIYMPAAVRGIYDVSVVVDTYGVPTPGGPSRYSVDEGNDQMVIPLGIYRAGVNNEGSFSVSISVNVDTVGALISNGTLAGVEVLPSDAYSLPSSVLVNDGNEVENFNLTVDMDFLRSNPGKLYAIAVEIATSERRINPQYKRTVVLIDSDLAI